MQVETTLSEYNIPISTLELEDVMGDIENTFPTKIMLHNRHQVLDLAPDSTTAKAANNFSRPAQWPLLEGNEKVLWGTCKTSNRSYTVWSSLVKKKYKCSCKNKMPCRHVLGLLLVYINQSDAFRVTYELPYDINEWLNDKTTTTPERSAQNKASRLRNYEKRLHEMGAGLDDLEIWLADVIRQGLAALEQQPPEFWEGIASRMVDAKLGSIARRIRLMPELIQTAPNWYELLLAQLGETYLIVKGFRNIERLPDALQQEMLNLAGVNYKKEKILEQEGFKDNWLIMGQVSGVEEKLNFRRTSLLGETSKHWGVLLEFTWGNKPYDTNWKIGEIVQGELVYYPSSYPLRALFKSYEYLPRSIEQLPAYPHHTAFLTAYSKALAANPWINSFPTCIKQVIPLLQGKQLYLLDEQHKLLPIIHEEKSMWKLLAISGGHPIRVFGEWNGQFFLPLSAFVEERFIRL